MPENEGSCCSCVNRSRPRHCLPHTGRKVTAGLCPTCLLGEMLVNVCTSPTTYKSRSFKIKNVRVFANTKPTSSCLDRHGRHPATARGRHTHSTQLSLSLDLPHQAIRHFRSFDWIDITPHKYCIRLVRPHGTSQYVQARMLFYSRAVVTSFPMIALRPLLNNRSDHFPPQRNEKSLLSTTTCCVLRSSVRHEISKAALGLTTYVMSCLKWRGEGAPSVRQDGRKKAIRQRAHTQKNNKQKPGDASFRLYPSRESTTQNVRAIPDCSRFVQAFHPSALHTRPPLWQTRHIRHTQKTERQDQPHQFQFQETNRLLSPSPKNTQQPTTTRVPSVSVHPPVHRSNLPKKPACNLGGASDDKIQSNPIDGPRGHDPSSQAGVTIRLFIRVAADQRAGHAPNRPPYTRGQRHKYARGWVLHSMPHEKAKSSERSLPAHLLGAREATCARQTGVGPPTPTPYHGGKRIVWKVHMCITSNTCLSAAAAAVPPSRCNMTPRQHALHVVVAKLTHETLTPSPKRKNKTSHPRLREHHRHLNLPLSSNHHVTLSRQLYGRGLLRRPVWRRAVGCSRHHKQRTSSIILMKKQLLVLYRNIKTPSVRK